MPHHPPGVLAPPSEPSTATEPPLDRRALLGRLARVLGGTLVGALTIPAALMVSDPLRRRSAPPALVPVAHSSEVPDLDRDPRAAPLRAPVVVRGVVDAWSRGEASRQGAVWLFRGHGVLRCLSAQCPHGGCAIDYDGAQRRFHCPCHDSSFALDGSRQHGPTPRGMDDLDVEERGGRVLCRFVRFRSGRAQRESV